MTKDQALKERDKYTSLQPDIIPIDNTDGVGKKPFIIGWSKVSDTQTLWDQIKSDINLNLGLRCNRIAAIDCDTVATHDRVVSFMSELGYHDIPIEMTNRGSHFFIQLPTKPSTGESKKLDSSLQGEIKYGKGTQIVIAPSNINGKVRMLENATPETLYNKAPVIQWSDLSRLLPQTKETKYIAHHTVSIPEIKRPLDLRPYVKDWAFTGLQLCRDLPKGSRIFLDARHDFNSRSECQFTVAAYLYTLGYDIDEIKEIFTSQDVGHKEDFDWLIAKVLMLNHRPVLYDTFKEYDTTSTNYTHAAFKALIACAWQLNRTKDFFISYKAMTEYLGLPITHKVQLQRAVKRLEKDGFIKVKTGTNTKNSAKRFANEYELVCDLTKIPRIDVITRTVDGDIDNIYVS